jgi:AraC-like DNA-binding protein/ligand-binding sensor protein
MAQQGNSSDAQSLLKALSDSQVYQDYERAFTTGTGLPLRLHEPEMMEVVRQAREKENPFCALLAHSNEACAVCYALQRRLEEEAQTEPRTLKCFAGLCESAVPIRIAGKLIAFLQTGQVLLHTPSQQSFSRIAQTILDWGAQVDLKKLEEAYFNTRVLSLEQYRSLVRLLEIFASHLESCGNVLALKQSNQEHPAIRRARVFIHDHMEDELTLSKVANVVNMSATYFSEKFREATGITFVEFVTRTRVEKACNLLQNPQRRISEVAFAVGFQSLSQFNRAFKRFTGSSPSEYRERE